MEIMTIIKLDDNRICLVLDKNITVDLKHGTLELTHEMEKWTNLNRQYEVETIFNEDNKLKVFLKAKDKKWQ